MLIKQIAFSVAFAALAVSVASAQIAPAADSFQPIRFLVGKWTGGGKTDSGQAQGTSVFKEELQGHVLVRRDSNGFAGQGKKAALYEQMMVIAPSGAAGGGYTASYWDSVGHNISYTGTVSSVNDMPQVQFVSGAMPDAPQFRLTYTQTSAKIMHVKFEMQPPGGEPWHTIAEGDDTKTGK